MPFCWAAAGDEPIIRMCNDKPSAVRPVPRLGGRAVDRQSSLWRQTHLSPSVHSSVFSKQQTFCLHAVRLKMGASYGIHLKYLPLNSLTYYNSVSTDMKKTCNWWILIPKCDKVSHFQSTYFSLQNQLEQRLTTAAEHTSFSLDSIFIYALNLTMLPKKKTPTYLLCSCNT